MNKVLPREAKNIILQWNLKSKVGDISSTNPVARGVTNTTNPSFGHVFEQRDDVDLKMQDNSHYNRLTKSV